MSFGTIVLRFWSVQSLARISSCPNVVMAVLAGSAEIIVWETVHHVRVGCSGVDYALKLRMYFCCFVSLEFVKTYRSSLKC